MAKYLFKRIDTHYVEVEADSIEEARAEVRHLSCTDSEVENEQGEWEIYSEEKEGHA